MIPGTSGMIGIRTVTTLRRKREEIRRKIHRLRRKAIPGQDGLSYVSAGIATFQGVSEGTPLPPYVDVHRVFAHCELMDLAKRPFAERPHTRVGSNGLAMLPAA
jgi:hypothetical protein